MKYMEFYSYSISEINQLLEEYELQKKLDRLDLAVIFATLNRCDEPYKLYDEMRESIINKTSNIEKEDKLDKNTLVRYKNICTRLKLKFPNVEV